MKNVFISMLLTLFAIIFLSCSSSTDLDYYQMFRICSSRDTSDTYDLIAIKGQNAQENTIDSLILKKVKILIKDLKLHQYHKSETENRLLETGPLAFIGDDDIYFLDTLTIREGIGYDKVKFEIHRFNENEISNYISDTLFSDFASPERYTVIIDGTYYSKGVPVPFSYRSTVTSNISINITNLECTGGGRLYDYIILMLILDPEKVFKSGDTILDPNDSKNKNIIDNAIKNGFRYDWITFNI